MIGRTSQTALGSSVIAGSRHRDEGLVAWLAEIAEMDQRGDWALDGCRSMVHWLGFFCGLSRPTAKDKLRVALALRTRDGDDVHRWEQCGVRVFRQFDAPKPSR